MRNSTKWGKGVRNSPEPHQASEKVHAAPGDSKKPAERAQQEAAATSQHDDVAETAPPKAAPQDTLAARGEPDKGLEDQLLRALAEQANIRQRAQREIEGAARFANAQFARDLLETVDNLRLAISNLPAEASADSRIKPMIAGVLATERALMSTLARHGIVPIDALGQAFDPAFHEAVHLVADAGSPSGTVIEVSKPGYMHHDRLLRPAAVHVSMTPEPGEDQ
jgi:molecular chaperone GrpE